MQFGLKNKKVTIGIAVCLAILAVVAFRIYSNMALNRERAARVFQGTTASVDTAIVKRQDIVPTLKFSANLEPVWSADISPKIDSRLDKLYVNEGDYVTAGQILAEMDKVELGAQVFQAEGLIYEAMADSEDAAREYERNTKLYEQNAISKKEVDNSKSRKDMTAGRYTAAQGALKVLKEKLDGLTIRAPRDGVVTRRYVQAGVFLKSGSPIVSVADTTVLLAKSDISEGQIGNVYMDAPAKITVAAYEGKSFSGQVSRISPLADLPARTFKTEIRVPNPNNQLRAGMYAAVSVSGQTHRSAVVIPQTAVVMREDQKTVYVVNADNVVQQKLLELGAVEEGWVEVLKGLSEGERIVVSGQNKLRQGVKIKYDEPSGEKAGTKK